MGEARLQGALEGQPPALSSMPGVTECNTADRVLLPLIPHVGLSCSSISVCDCDAGATEAVDVHQGRWR
eukprot:8413-Eustigmatos_ZCMA.PRE.1